MAAQENVRKKLLYIHIIDITLRVRLHDTATAPMPWTAFLPWGKMGTEPNEHGMLSTALTPSTATAPALSCVNGLIDSNITHFHGNSAVDSDGNFAVPCKRTLRSI